MTKKENFLLNSILQKTILGRVVTLNITWLRHWIYLLCLVYLNSLNSCHDLTSFNTVVRDLAHIVLFYTRNISTYLIIHIVILYNTSCYFIKKLSKKKKHFFSAVFCIKFVPLSKTDSINLKVRKSLSTIDAFSYFMKN